MKIKVIIFNKGIWIELNGIGFYNNAYLMAKERQFLKVYPKHIPQPNSAETFIVRGLYVLFTTPTKKH